MKKNYRSYLLGLALLAGTSQAQVSSLYTFSQFSGSFTAITGGTVFGTTTSDDQTFTDPSVPGGGANNGPGIPIGFNFMFNNNIYNRFGINNNGWIGFGNSSLSPAVDLSNTGSNYTGLSSASNAPAIKQNRVAGLSRDIQAQAGASLRVETIGSAPTRTCVIQFLGYKKFGSNGTGDDFNFQIRLIETTNIVQVIYGNFVNNANAGVAEVGLRGNSNADFNNRITDNTNPWSASIPGTANNSNVNYNNAGLVPASGQVYQWTPPQCSGTMTNLVAVAVPTLICPNANASIFVQNTSTLSGITYTWYVSTMSSVGVWTLVPGADGPVYATPSISVTTWYQAVLTCQNSASTGTSSAAQVQVAGTTTNTVPYFESFEGITVNDRLPNCSWLAPALGTSFQTYISSNTSNRVPRTGSKFGAFVAPTSTNTGYVYTNGIYMQPGITYSAAVHFATEYSGANNWSSFALLVGDAQAAASLTLLAQESPAISGPYKLVSNTFQVGTAGFYYVAFRALGVSGSAPYLMIDDISVTIPCTPQSGNTPTIAVQAASTLACLGTPVVVNASGADVYNWSDSNTGSSGTFTPGALGYNLLTIVGTSTLTNCQGTGTIAFNVQAPPVLNGSANPPINCAGGNVVITVSGANTYNWLHGPTTPQVIVAPTTSTVYMVVGTAVNGCTASVSFPVTTNPLPVIVAGADRPLICLGETATLTAGGASAYQWVGSINSSLLQGSQVIISPSVSDTYTVTGTDANGCMDTEVVTVAVDPCTGLASNGAQGRLSVYPNPGAGFFLINLAAPGTASIDVLDMTGRKVLSTTLGAGGHELDLRSLAAGVYYIRAATGHGVESVRLIKQ